MNASPTDMSSTKGENKKHDVTSQAFSIEKNTSIRRIFNNYLLLQNNDLFLLGGFRQGSLYV